MRAGLAIRQEAALRAANAKPCPQCGHVSGGHHELRPTIDRFEALPEPRIVSDPNPAYQPLHFHCDDEGCDCVRVVAV